MGCGCGIAGRAGPTLAPLNTRQLIAKFSSWGWGVRHPRKGRPPVTSTVSTFERPRSTISSEMRIRNPQLQGDHGWLMRVFPGLGTYHIGRVTPHLGASKVYIDPYRSPKRCPGCEGFSVHEFHRKSHQKKGDLLFPLLEPSKERCRRHWLRRGLPSCRW